MGDQENKWRKIYLLTNQLKNIGPNTTAPIKFILEKTPFDDIDDDEDQCPSETNGTITGRLLPKSTVYRNGSLPIDIVLGPNFPVKPPKIFSKIQLFHPNVERTG